MEDTCLLVRQKSEVVWGSPSFEDSGYPPWMLSALLLVHVTEGVRTREWTQPLLARLVFLSLS